jgi:hypothetical protein
MIRMPRRALLVLAVLGLCACQSPTDPDETPDIIEVTVSPDPATAAGPTGKTYKIEGDENEPDEIREYPWKATFNVAVRLTDAANDSNVGLDLPLDITAATVKVQQASGGIVTPPTGSEVEKYEFVIAQASSNRFTAVNSTINMTFDVWYALPNTRREALVTVTLGFADSGNYQFTEVVPVKVAP